MSSDFVSKRIKLSDICTDITYGYTASADAKNVGPKFLRITDIQGGVVSWDAVPYCQIEKSLEPKYLLEKGDIVVARTGNSTGENYIFNKINKSEKVVFASYLIRFRVNKEVAYPYFIWYQMRSGLWWNFVNSAKTGSAQAGANAKVLGTFELVLPSLPDQIKIASVLQALDDRINLLRETNATLEAIAQALFKSWFVDFDPVRAKAEGRQPEGIDAETAALFPDSFEESEVGLVPKGWKVRQIGEVVQVLGGGTPSTKEPAFWHPEEYHWVTPKDLSGIFAPILLNTDRKISTQGLSKVSSGLLPINTLLMSSRAPIGYLAIAKIPTAINQGFIAVLPHEVLSPEFMLLWCQQNMESIKQKASGSTFMEISKSAFRPILIVQPTVDVLGSFNRITVSLFERITEKLCQIQTLTNLRGTLLPRLISGHLQLPEFEEIRGIKT